MFGFKKKEDPMQEELRKLNKEANERMTPAYSHFLTSEFSMTVEDVFTITGRGTVATGKIEKGSISVGDTVSINGEKKVKVTGIEMFRKNTNTATAGDNVGLLLSDVTKSDICRGQVLSK